MLDDAADDDVRWRTLARLELLATLLLDDDAHSLEVKSVDSFLEHLKG